MVSFKNGRTLKAKANRAIVRPFAYGMLASSLLLTVACSGMMEKTESNLKDSSAASNAVSNSSASISAGTATQSISKSEQNFGVKIVGLRSTMAGMMIDFRYKVVDAAKAAPLLDLNTEAYLVVEKSGAKLGVPHSVKVGALRQTTHAKKVKEGRDYFVMFGNPGRKLAKPGDKVAVVIGDFKAEHLILQ